MNSNEWLENFTAVKNRFQIFLDNSKIKDRLTNFNWKLIESC